VAKIKTTVDDFLALLDDSEEDSPASWSKKATTQDPEKVASKKRVAIGLQSDDNRSTSRTTEGLQSDDNKSTMRAATRSNRSTSRTTGRSTEGLQSDDNKSTIGLIHLLIGHERRLLEKIFNLCLPTGSPVSPPTRNANLREELKISHPSTFKTVRARLQQKGFLAKSVIKKGPGGWVQYKIPHEIWQQLVTEWGYNKSTEGLQSDDNRSTSRTTNQTTTLSSSSSGGIFDKNTTTTHLDYNPQVKAALSPDWQGIDYEPLKEIGFSQSHLLQVIRAQPKLDEDKRLTPEQLKEAISWFSFDLLENNKAREIRTTPLNYFMGLMVKGSPYARPANYESLEDTARRKYFESKQAYKAKKEAQEREILDLEFESWVEGISVEEKRDLVPTIGKAGGPVEQAGLRRHFEENVWPSQKKEIESGM